MPKSKPMVLCWRTSGLYGVDGVSAESTTRLLLARRAEAMLASFQHVGQRGRRARLRHLVFRLLRNPISPRGGELGLEGCQRRRRRVSFVLAWRRRRGRGRIRQHEARGTHILL